MSDFATEADWKNHLLRGGPFLDVRAPIEFASGSAPQSKNLPLLNDEERHQVGLCYKEQGPDAAEDLGHRLVSGIARQERIEGWVESLNAAADTLLYCFRGGKRSAIAQAWLKDSGITVQRIPGGYKSIRQHLLNGLNASASQISVTTLGGHTGSGKTVLLRQLKKQKNGTPIVDLENLARHRGSAFGQELDTQPAQADFENHLSVALMRAIEFHRSVWMEDEARTIGKITLPDCVFQRLRTGPLVLIDEPQSRRAEIIFQEYVKDQLKDLKLRFSEDAAWAELQRRLTDPVQRISRKLGGARTAQVLQLIHSAIDRSQTQDQWDGHLAWILFLLENYYDPYYKNHADRNAERVVFRGSRSEVADYFLRTSIK